MQAKQNKASLWETIKSKYAIFLVLVVLFVSLFLVMLVAGRVTQALIRRRPGGEGRGDE